MTKPTLSIITPFAGSKILKYFLQSLQYQTLDPNFFELILIEDGSKGANEILNLFKTKFKIHLIPLLRPKGFNGHSAGLCRNTGTRFASGKYLHFIDSDCILHPECLEKHLNVLKQSKNIAVCGGVSELQSINWDQLQEGYFESFSDLEKISRKDHRINGLEHELVHPEEKWDFWYTCNASVRKEHFDSVKGFDELGFRCHDLDLAYRLLKKGCRFEYIQDASLIHVEHPRSIKTRYQQLQGLKNLANKFPELDSYVFDRIIQGKRYQFKLAEKCEKRFLQIIENLDGYRIGYSWITPLSFQFENIWDELLYMPFEILEQEDNVRITLGLHRNCWDYNIVIPTIKNVLSPQISILIPSFNSGKKILKALSSVLLQSLQNFEVIIVDDASEDNSIHHISDLLKDNRVRVVSLAENVGLSKALNVGLQYSNAPIILHLDSDDWLEPTALEEVLKAFIEIPTSVAVYGDAIVHSNENIYFQEGLQLHKPSDFFNYSPYQVPRAYRKEKLIEIGGWNISDAYSGRYYEDRLMLATLSSKGNIKWLNKRLYNVSDRENSLSRKNPYLSASAKLSILWNEANIRSHTLDYKFNGRILKGKLMPYQKQKNFLKWSIIIPFRKGAEQLYYSVRSWLESDFMENEGEIIIVNDGSIEDLKVIEFLDKNKIKILHLQEKKGPAFARNAGYEIAKYHMLFFSDSDHIVPPDVLGKHAARHLKLSKEGVVIGCIFGRRTFSVVTSDIQQIRKEKLLELLYLSDEFSLNATSLACGNTIRFIEKESTLTIWEQSQEMSFTDSWLSDWGKIILKFGEELHNYDYKWTRVSTGSMSIKKSVFATIGGFDERLKSMEDWEFGIRTQKADFSIVCAPEAEPFHQVHPIDETRAENDQYAISYLLTKHKGYIDNLINQRGNFLPPSCKFLKQVLNRKIQNLSPTLTNFKFSEKKEVLTDFCLITFDDGPHPYGTRLVLDILKKNKAKAIFFLLGSLISDYKELVHEIITEGHEIGVHSWVHTSSENYTILEMTDLLKRTVEEIKQITQISPKYARPPYGQLTPSYLTACKTLDLQIIGWDLSSKDWSAISEKEIISRITVKGFRKKVLLFHDGGNAKHTAKALDWLLNICSQSNIKTVLPNDFKQCKKLPILKTYNPYT